MEMVCKGTTSLDSARIMELVMLHLKDYILGSYQVSTDENFLHEVVFLYL